MKRKIFSAALKAAAACFIGLAAIVVSSCDMLGPSHGAGAGNGEGQLRIAFSFTPDEATRALAEIPDTSDFILTVSNASGDVIYDGKYGDSPEAIMVKAGSYTVSVVSEKFSKPAFSKPQYGDCQCVVVPSGGVANVRLTCSQVNCGIKLDIDSGFLDACPDGVLFLKSDEGKLMYGYSEKRIAYFLPGNVSLVLARAGKEEVLMTRALEARQVLMLGVNVSPTYSGNGTPSEEISVSLDTARVWISDAFTIGGNGPEDDDASTVLTVAQAKASVGEEGVWVNGYVVGGDLTSASASFEAPFSSRTCILLGPRSVVSDRSSCISVQLPAGEVREALNLVDNQELLGRKVSVRGDIVATYYGLVGLKNCTDYKL